MLPVLIWVVVATVATSFLCSVLEAVLLSITHSHVVMLQERGDPAGDVLETMRRQIDEPIAAILTLNTIANTLGATTAGALAATVFGQSRVVAFSVFLTTMILLFAEIVPKTIGATFWPRLSRMAAWVLRIMIVIMKPILVPLSWFARLIAGDTSRPSVSRAEIAILAEIGRREGQLDEDEWQVVSNVIRLDEVTLAEVMTPRTDMTAVPVDASIPEAMDVMLDEGHLRLPVFDGSLDRIVGILLARDLWRADREGADGTLRDVMRPPLFAPSGKPVEDLIPEMRVQRYKMAIVVDEFGGTAGLVTLEDLIEEIIGEIQDEHEGDEPDNFFPLEDDSMRVWGGVPVRDASDALSIVLPEEPHDTLGGYLFGQLGRVGRVGDVVHVGDSGFFRITRMRGRRIEYAVWQPATPVEGDED